MRRSRQLVLESAAIASILIMVTLGGSIATTLIPPSFASLNNPDLVTKQYSLRALALYYNVTLTDIGTAAFAGASFLLGTFQFANIPLAVTTAVLAANTDLVSVNRTVPSAILDFDLARSALSAKDYSNATALISAGCAQAKLASQSIDDFQGPRTSGLQSLSVPTSVYEVGASLTAAEVQALFAECDQLQSELPHPTPGVVLTISSSQKTVETGGSVALDGSLTLDGVGAPGQEALFYVNGTHFGTLVTDGAGNLSGTLAIPFLYKPLGVVQAVVAPNATRGIGGAMSNLLNFTILFNETNIAMADPPAYLPTQSFRASGNLTTASGVPLPSAPVSVSFLGESLTAVTDSKGEFHATLTVPANATDGTYYVYAAFAPQGVLGPSFNFTSIRVVHIPLHLVVSAPFSFAGLPTHLSGSASANGTALSGARVTVDTPWGSFATVTNSSGQFRLGFVVSPLAFALEGRIRASAAPPEPYVSSGSASADMGTFNLLIVFLPAVVLGTATYEADKLGVFEGLRSRRKLEAVTTVEAPRGAEETPVSGAVGAPEAVDLYRRALELASARFGLRFGRGQTIREALGCVERAEPPQGYGEFTRISLAAEDFLYAETFDPSRLEEVRRDLGSLEEYWR